MEDFESNMSVERSFFTLPVRHTPLLSAAKDTAQPAAALQARRRRPARSAHRCGKLWMTWNGQEGRSR